MDVLHTLKNAYVKEREATTMRNHFTLRGFFSRLFNAEKYWDELTTQESQLLDLGAQTLSDIIARQPKTSAELKTYQLILKNINAKLTERGNFLLALVTLITAFGLTKTAGMFDWGNMSTGNIKLLASKDSLMLLIIAGLTIVLAVKDALRVRNRAAIHEELVNVIERYLQGTPITLTPPAPLPIIESSGVEKRIFEAIFNQKTYSALFKAGTVMVGIALVGMSQTSLTLYEKELDAYTSKFKIEATTHRPLQQTDCKFLGALEAECFMAQHKLKTSDSAVDLLGTVVNTALGGGLSCFLAAMFVFICTPFVRQTTTE
ncbi:MULTISPECIES: hypothetical protein [Pseudomonas]|jgi:hypothetical protein|uniref:hypothetical protein n=1 Tax=Pseudomonas TaxID=286 RepID=UPI00090876C9|nr:MULTISPECIES: hypothetical protein [Pseudomonas]TCV69839.1 hypothetical protein EDB98_101257 [Pseudomonas fluorescens]SFW31078.1 hypothetical protein SAMN03159439_01173 [Pseudomonas sp. NFACC04-2]